jgi:hypothetical protein
MSARKLVFVGFWLFVAISAAYAAFQMAVSAGLATSLAQAIAGIVFGVVVLTADRVGPK